MFTFVLLGFLVSLSSSATPTGVLPLDTITFPKIVDGSKTILVKFDKKYGYGDTQNEWETLAEEIATSKNLLLCEVGVQEHGDEENKQLADSYSISIDDFPQFRLFKIGSDISLPLVFSDQVSSDNLKRFLKSSGVNLVLEGCLEEFDVLAQLFVNNPSDRNNIGEKGKELLNNISSENEKDIKSAKYYMKVMAKTTKDDKYPQNEINRLNKILSGEAFDDSKIGWFKIRLNILSSFIIDKEEKEEENKQQNKQQNKQEV